MAITGWMECPETGQHVQFLVSEETIRTPSNWQWSGKALYSTQSRHNQDSITEFTGRDTDTMDFDLQLVAEYGMVPMDEMVTLWDLMRNARPLQITIGFHPYGRYRWTITQLDITNEVTAPEGQLAGITVAVKCLEYLKT